MLYIDASRYGNTTQRTGVEHYSRHLIQTLAQLAPGEITLVAPKKVDLEVPQITIPFPRLWTQVRLSWEVFRNKKIDNLFVPSHLMPLVHPKKTTITIHDVAFRRFPKSYGFLSRTYLEWGTKFAVKNAWKIIVPSESTKTDLVTFYKADPSKITVIPLGFEAEPPSLHPEQAAQVLERFGLKAKQYFLFLGRIESKKNIQTLIEAFSALSPRCPGIQLVLAGKLGVGGEQILQQVKNPDIVVTGYVDEVAKQALLENALCFVYPSLFEGFGIPLLEAMSTNLPIIASKIPSSLELAKDNAQFFEAEDAEALMGLMEKVATDEGFRKDMTKNHAKTLERFSWKRCGEETLKVLGSEI
jgi:glycosyltransferase involved in cell wall biosynthesis